MDAARVIREPGIRPNTHFYHIGDGFHYRLNRVSESGNSVYFICAHVRCPGRAKWCGENFTHTQAHNHPADMNFTTYRHHRRNIVQRARTVRYVSFRDIVEEERARTPHQVAPTLTYRSLRSAMFRSRAAVFPSIPHTLQELNGLLSNPAWHHLTVTNDNADNLYGGGATASDGSFVVLFCSQRGLESLRLATLLFADGTFYIRPSIDGCYQVFAIVTVNNHTVIPLAWFLMERKSEAAYVEALLLLRSKLRVWNIITVICDYEDAMMNAFRLVLGVDVQGCLFHSAQDMANYARIHLGISNLRNYPFLKYIVDLCCALPLLPGHLLQRGFNVIFVQASLSGPFFYLLSSFLDYVQREWLNHTNRGQTMSVCGSSFRTNNASESNNRRMKRKILVHRPNVYHFLRHLADFEDSAHSDLQSLLMGHDPTRSRSSFAVSNDSYIQEITANLLRQPYVTDQELLQFLINASVTMRRLVNETIQRPRRR